MKLYAMAHKTGPDHWKLVEWFGRIVITNEKAAKEGLAIVSHELGKAAKVGEAKPVLGLIVFKGDVEMEHEAGSIPLPAGYVPPPAPAAKPLLFLPNEARKPEGLFKPGGIMPAAS